MPSMVPFHSVREVHKPPQNRVYHNNSEFLLGRSIRQDDRRSGSGRYRLCTECNRLTRQGR